MNRWSGFLVLLLFTGCVEDRFFPTREIFIPQPEKGKYGINSILINEFIASACRSSEVNSNGCLGIVSTFYSPTESKNGKWVELFNPGDTTVNLGTGQWFITDDSTKKDKFRLPKNTKIEAKSHLIICCDNSTTQHTDMQIHAPFSMGRYSGDIGLYFKEKTGSDSVFITVNHLHYVVGAWQVPGYDSTARHISYGRYPDGNGGQFVRLSKATPGTANKP